MHKWRGGNRAIFLCDIGFQPSDLGFVCERSRLDGKVHWKRGVGPGCIICDGNGLNFKKICFNKV